MWSVSDTCYVAVKPDATPEQIDDVVRGGETVQVFAQAATSQRFAQGQSAYNAVKERHDEVVRIEKQLIELSQLFNDVRFNLLHMVST